MFSEVDSTNLESIKSARKKVATPRFGGSPSSTMRGPKGKKKANKKAPKKTVIK